MILLDLCVWFQKVFVWEMSFTLIKLFTFAFLDFLVIGMYTMCHFLMFSETECRIHLNTVCFFGLQNLPFPKYLWVGSVQYRQVQLKILNTGAGKLCQHPQLKKEPEQVLDFFCNTHFQYLRFQAGVGRLFPLTIFLVLQILMLTIFKV